MHQLIVANRGCCTISDLANHVKKTSRTVHRIFRSTIGISPKEYVKIIRFNYALKLIHSFPDYDWQDVVFNCGYHDQMHFIHEFKLVMKCTPSLYLHTPDKIKEHYTQYNVVC